MYNTMGVTQRVARVCLRQLSLLSSKMFFGRKMHKIDFRRTVPIQRAYSAPQALSGLLKRLLPDGGKKKGREVRGR